MELRALGGPSETSMLHICLALLTLKILNGFKKVNTMALRFEELLSGLKKFSQRAVPLRDHERALKPGKTLLTTEFG